MSLRLTLVRHAKSDWTDPASADYDRPLNARGRRDCPHMAEWLRANQIRPQRCLISGARRTRETAHMLMAALSAGTPAGERAVEVFDDRLYHAEPAQLLTVLRETSALHETSALTETPDDCQWIMLVGHNPGLTALANLLSPVAVHADLPTLAVVTFECSFGRWRDLQPGQCRLQSLMTPKGLRIL